MLLFSSRLCHMDAQSVTLGPGEGRRPDIPIMKQAKAEYEAAVIDQRMRGCASGVSGVI
jgi:hypothetical protein